MSDAMQRERSLKVFWALCPGLEASTLRKLIRVFTSATAMHSASVGKWTEAVRLHPKTIAYMNRWRERNVTKMEEMADQLTQRHIAVVVSGDDKYPEVLNDLHDPPVVLFVRGDEALLNLKPIVSVVGTRRATSYGLEATRWISSTLVRAECTVCSGLALGIDTASHQTALQNHGKTIAVLGSAIDSCYPPSNRTLYDNIQNEGLLVSEYGPGKVVAKFRFPERNRIISALGQAVVVVQAGDKSGAILTAEHAMEIGRDVYVVPGPITSKSFRGSHRLLVDGAIPLVDPVDLIGEVSGTGGAEAQDVRLIPDHLHSFYQVLNDEGALRAGELATVLAVPPAHIYTALLEMEINGLVRRLADGRYAVRAYPERS